MSKIKSCNVTVMVSNMSQAIKFYTETLGLTLKNKYGDHWADIEGPGISIGLHPTQREIIRSDNLQIGLNVANLEEAIAKLEKKGVQFTMNKDDQVRIAYFNDPDRNTLYLIQSQY